MLIQTNADRLWDDLMQTAMLGKVKGNGLTRLAFDENDKKIRQWFEATCHNLGGSVRTDRVGNQFARFFSTNDTQPTILVGSHLDTQPQGGRFDGILGVLAGIEVIRAFQEAHYKPGHAIEVINWTNEEGARFSPPMMGSAYACGHLKLQDVLNATDRDSLTVGDISGGFRSENDVLDRITASAYLELHIEQGPVLEKAGKDIGIVTAITGVSWLTVTFHGRASHAGTTPLSYRNDSLIKAAKFIISFQDYLKRHSDKIIGTIGRIENAPNTPNTVPAETKIYIDLRSSDKKFFDNARNNILTILTETLKFSEHDYQIAELSKIDPTPFSTDITDNIGQAAKKAGLSARTMISGAGHDALQLAKHMPTAMIFVPCKNGISHHVDETIDKIQAKNGADVMANTIIELDKRNGSPT
ncbi:M20 family metallo-hydrolase [Acetobacteraceae bacterium ESL0709]|nr:M20 family metallo-hydrolase [Acetobacteraceae bacterium ESL0697]MDF7677894.1 M20 family metallo-hydrolase [Acetobacteraceae bacterium ESL0709]